MSKSGEKALKLPSLLLQPEIKRIIKNKKKLFLFIWLTTFKNIKSSYVSEIYFCNVAGSRNKKRV